MKRIHDGVLGDVLMIKAQRHATEDLPHDATLLSYHLAGHLPMSPQDRQRTMGPQMPYAELVHVKISWMSRWARSGSREG